VLRSLFSSNKVMDVINDVIDFFTSFFVDFNTCYPMMSNGNM